MTDTRTTNLAARARASADAMHAPERLYPRPTECEQDVVAVGIGLETYYAVQLHQWDLPTADEWARAHAAYDAAILTTGIIPDEAEMYSDVLRDVVHDYPGMSIIVDDAGHTMITGEGEARHWEPLPLTVAEDGRQIAAMLLSGSPMASGLTGMALAEALRAWLAPCAAHVLGIHREGVALMYGD